MDEIVLWRNVLAATRLCPGMSILDLTPAASGTSSRLRWTASTRAPLSSSTALTPPSTDAMTRSVSSPGALTGPMLLSWFTRAESTPSPRETTPDPFPLTVSVAPMITITASRSKLGRFCSGNKKFHVSNYLSSLSNCEECEMMWARHSRMKETKMSTWSLQP